MIEIVSVDLLKSESNKTLKPSENSESTPSILPNKQNSKRKRSLFKPELGKTVENVLIQTNKPQKSRRKSKKMEEKF